MASWKLNIGDSHSEDPASAVAEPEIAGSGISLGHDVKLLGQVIDGLSVQVIIHSTVTLKLIVELLPQASDAV